jgi:peptidoglycan hydrolase-like protein with peptidoglycan-binding domain
MDYRVLQAQQWVNATYKDVSDYVPCAETGVTGWPVMYSLTRGLQHELGITALSDAFGPTTTQLLTAYGPISASTPNVNMRTIVEAAMYCKGYTGGDIDGGFGSVTQAGCVAWKTDMGFAASGTDNSVSVKEMKTLLTMDAYVLLPGGDAAVRAVQRWMNATFIGRQDFAIVPCDGLFSRGVQQGLMLAIQYSIGMADGVANGNFGPGTRAGLQSAAATLSVGTSDSGSQHFVRLFKGDYQTWCSLLVSTGDPDRQGRACDCMTPLNDARAKAIAAAGYETVGRYIAGGTQKILTTSEIQVLFDNGLTFFPIYQESNTALNLFTTAIGNQQGRSAHANALDLGLPRGSIIYFAVDFDATADEVRSNIIPFFRGVAAAFDGLGNYYSVGIYGSRNICSMVCDAGYAISSFVGGMSTGFSGNLGFPLPANWAFDQIKTLTLASGTTGEIEVDKDIKSNRDPGISSLTKPIDQNVAFFTWVAWIEARASEWVSAGHTDNTVQQLTAQYLRTYIDDRYDSAAYDGYVGGVSFFDTVSGAVDHDFITYCAAAKGRPDPGSLRDPKTGYLQDIQHFGAALGAVLKHSVPTGTSGVSMADFGGWAGDLITADADCYTSGVSDADAYTYAYGMIGNSAGQGSFGARDVLADIDAMVVGLAIKADGSLRVSSALSARYSDVTAATARYREFVTARFGSAGTLQGAAGGVMTQNSDAEFDVFRGGLWLKATGVPIAVSTGLHASMFANVATAFADVVTQKFAA